MTISVTMRFYTLLNSILALEFLLSCSVSFSKAQIVGCDAPSMDCPTKATATDDGLCSFDDRQFGAGFFQSNITTDGPLSWTVMADDKEGTSVYPDSSGRTFYLGTPPSLELSRITDFGACSTVFWNFTAILQPPADGSDPKDLGCQAVMGDQCARDVVNQVRTELLSLINATYYPPQEAFPCSLIQQAINSPPESCRQVFEGANYLYGQSQIFTNTSGPTPQNGCAITPGGEAYNLYATGSEDTLVLFDYNAEPEVKPSKEYMQAFKTGVTPILTLFYNEPWNNASTGPVSFLEQPEVHLSCVRTITEDDKASGAAQTELRLPIWSFGVLGSLLLTFTVL